MTTCKTVTRKALTDPLDVRIDREGLDFDTARRIADQKAMEVASEPMLMAWYNAHSGQFSPEVECCSEQKPGWIVYAESRGATITIDINDEEYVFIYGEFSQASTRK